MRVRVRKALDAIDKVLAKGDKASSDLWNIMAALRSSDDNRDYGLKSNYTIPIRRAAFPRTRKRVMGDDGINIPGSFWGGDDLVDVRLEPASTHYKDHVTDAQKAIRARGK